jgi:hypothetical protein
VPWDEVFIRILDPKSGQLLRGHVRQTRDGYRVREQDVFPRRPWKVSQLLWRAEPAGTQIGVLCHHIYNQQGQLGVRRIQGVPAKKYSTAASEDDCAAALEMGVREYRFVRRYLERTPQLSLRQSTLSFANSFTIAISSTKKLRSQPHECERVESCSTPAPIGGYGRGAGNSSASSPSRTDARDRLSLVPGRATNGKHLAAAYSTRLCSIRIFDSFRRVEELSIPALVAQFPVKAPPVPLTTLPVGCRCQRTET